MTELRRHARRGLPGAVRGAAWAAMLGVDVGRGRGEHQGGGEGGCGEAELRQMGRDVPRCHGYDEVVGSGEGRARLGRVLATWAGRNPDLAYWQVGWGGGGGGCSGAGTRNWRRRCGHVEREATTLQRAFQGSWGAGRESVRDAVSAGPARVASV